MSMRLRDLIRSVRGCKTASDERAVISKECAAIRKAFKEEDAQFRYRNVAKLMYIHMLGYPTHWGQMECLKLLANGNYGEKRIGYLAMMLLLDERQEVLMLVTNSLKNDLHASNQFIAGLSLCSIGNISSPEICRDLSGEVQKLLSHANPYIRKKAALCSIRIIRKVPELVEEFVPKAKNLLGDRNHGVLVTGLALMIEICHAYPSAIETYRKNVPDLIRILKNLVLSGYAPEHDVSGITDPFIQVKILRLMRILATGSKETSDQINDILAQVATNTESSKSVGNSILYEAVQTIMSIESESGLRVLAINILGRFLLNRDNNIRYVALNTLSQVMSKDMQAVHRHRNTIIDCLKDPDISIRRRALELGYALVNQSNIKVLVRELLNYLMVADTEFRQDLTTKICIVVDKYAPSRRWHFDTMLRVLTTSGPFVKDEVVNGLIYIISTSDELHGYATSKLFGALKEGCRHGPLVQVAAWCIGEYGDLLVQGASLPEEPVTPPTELDVINLLDDILMGHSTPLVVRQVIINTLMKLTVRFSQNHTRIHAIVEAFNAHSDVELQQRTCEYKQLFTRDIRTSLLQKMPVLEENAAKKRSLADRLAGNTGSSSGADAAESPSTSTATKPALAAPAAAAAPAAVAAPAAAPSLIDDLLSLDAPAPTPAAAGGPPPGVNLMDDLLGGGSIAPAAAAPAAAPAGASGGGAMDLLSMMSSPVASPTSQPSPMTMQPQQTQPMAAAAAAPAATPTSFPSITVFEKNGLTIAFDFQKQPNNPAVTAINCRFMNSSPVEMSSFLFQTAVPKYIKLQINPASTSALAPGGGSGSQVLKIMNTVHGEKPVLMKLKISYTAGGQPVTEQLDVSNFPQGL